MHVRLFVRHRGGDLAINKNLLSDTIIAKQISYEQLQ